jgi:dolichyl-phosphate-mannose-protein mannosyltransferase
MRVRTALGMAALIAIEFAIAIATASLAATLCRADASATSNSAVAAPVMAASATASATGTEALQGPNLLSNGDFTTGSGRSPDGWRTGGWYEAPAVTSYDWVHAPDSEPELVVYNLQANDARWLQTMALGPGWYYIGAEARTEDVPPSAAGASVSLDEDSINSPDLHGAAGWQRLGLYLKVGAHGADVDVALRLGGFGSLNTGRAFFRKARVVKLDELPANAAPVFDLSAMRKSLVAPPVGKPWTLVAVFILLTIAAAIGWKIYGADDLAPAPVRTEPPRSMPRSERRRRKLPRRR